MPTLRSVNHAVDAVVTRFRRTAHHDLVERDGKPVLEFVCVRRTDPLSWALPGAFLRDGADVDATLKAAFRREVLASMAVEPANADAIVADLFRNGEPLALAVRVGWGGLFFCFFVTGGPGRGPGLCGGMPWLGQNQPPPPPPTAVLG